MKEALYKEIGEVVRRLQDLDEGIKKTGSACLAEAYRREVQELERLGALTIAKRTEAPENDLLAVGKPRRFSGVTPLDPYRSLREVLDMALEQAQGGKGLERHANGLPFDQQPICQGGRRFGVGCLIYQAWKKSHETPVLLALDNGKERAVRELLGVINYAAAAIIVLQEIE